MLAIVSRPDEGGRSDAASARRFGGDDLGHPPIKARKIPTVGRADESSDENAIAFRALARIDCQGRRTWASEWIEGWLIQESMAVGPDDREAVWSALGSLASAMHFPRLGIA